MQVDLGPKLELRTSGPSVLGCLLCYKHLI